MGPLKRRTWHIHGGIRFWKDTLNNSSSNNQCKAFKDPTEMCTYTLAVQCMAKSNKCLLELCTSLDLAQTHQGVHLLRTKPTPPPPCARSTPTTSPAPAVRVPVPTTAPVSNLPAPYPSPQFPVHQIPLSCTNAPRIKYGLWDV